MGRAKLNMVLIKKEKARNTTFHTRKNGLKKKVYELATLCGIKAMVIIYGPKQETPQARPLKAEIFPDNRDEVVQLINKYKGQSPEDRKTRTVLLSDFFKEMNKKAQQALTNLRNTNLQSKYPTWDSRFSSFMEKDLRRIAAILENNIENAKAKMGQMKVNNNDSNIIDCAYMQQQRMLTKKRSMDSEAGNQISKYFITIDSNQVGTTRVPVPMPMPIQQQRFPFMDHYQDQRMVNFAHDYVGGASNIVYDAHPSMALYNYPTMAETVDSSYYVNNVVREDTNYYGEGMQPIAQHLMEYHPMRPGSATHQMVATSHQADPHAQVYEDHKW